MEENILSHTRFRDTELQYLNINFQMKGLSHRLIEISSAAVLF